MDLGLYVSSFYFIHTSKKKSNYMELNSLFPYTNNKYFNIIDFFEDFFKAHNNIRNLYLDNKLYSIETDASWRGETDQYIYTCARINSGTYGVETDIYDVKSKAKVGSISKDQAGVLPFFVFVAVAKPGTSTTPINKGLIMFQSMGVYGVKSVTCKLLNEFSKSKMDCTFRTCNVSASEFLKAFFDIGRLKRLRLIRNSVSDDNSDLLEGVSYAREERVLSSFRGAIFSGLVDRLIQFGLSKSAVFEWENDITYDCVKATMDIGEGKERTVDLHAYDNLSIIEYVPKQYQKDNGHADEHTIIQYFCMRATEYLRKMDMTIRVVSKH